MKKKHVVVAGEIDYKMSNRKFAYWALAVLVILVLALINA